MTIRVASLGLALFFCFSSALAIAENPAACDPALKTDCRLTEPQRTAQLQALDTLLQDGSFKISQVAAHLDKDDFDGARTLLTKRIAMLDELSSKKLALTDRQPGLVDCTTLRVFVLLALDRTDEAKADLEKITKYTNSSTLRDKMLPLIDAQSKIAGTAIDTSAGYRKMAKEAAHSMVKMYEGGTQQAEIQQPPGSDKFALKTESTATGWRAVGGTESLEVVSAIAPAKDGGIVGVGYHSPGNRNDMLIKPTDQGLIFKVNSKGELLWHRAVGGDAADRLIKVIELPDGSYLAAGSTRSPTIAGHATSGSDDVYLLNISPSGEIKWEKTWGAAGYDTPVALLKKKDGGALLIANGSDSAIAPKTVWIMDVSTAGEITNKRNITLPGITELAAGTSSENGFYFAANIFPQKLTLFNTTPDGRSLWSKAVAGTSARQGAFDCIMARDGAFVLTGWEDLPKPENAAGGGPTFMIKFESTGPLQWKKNFGGMEQTSLDALTELPNGDFLAVGKTRAKQMGDSLNNGASDMYFVRVDRSSGAIQKEGLLGTALADEAKAVAALSADDVVIGGFSARGILQDGKLAGSLDIHLERITLK